MTQTTPNTSEDTEMTDASTPPSAPVQSSTSPEIQPSDGTTAPPNSPTSRQEETRAMVLWSQRTTILMPIPRDILPLMARSGERQLEIVMRNMSLRTDERGDGSNGVRTEVNGVRREVNGAGSDVDMEGKEGR
ncbi:hypothetical protein P280DRAFT_468547 [Massarina eburnea CBS 473.64]|uniref:Uncharacterized protein n=1 Tax=Massarina eburnea CBS 473.64 TaxID=1395130 RepID=A0A6A6S484_9PLEO|nr:hypothetical protein P280DRAFT_468547 [Massarina eburnea CBS 473.64]